MSDADRQEGEETLPSLQRPPDGVYHEKSHAVRRALATTLGWRVPPALAFSANDGAIVESTEGGAEPQDAHGAGRKASRPFVFGDLRLRLLAEHPAENELAREIPSTVTDTALRMIVEAHFAVWYVWHVRTASCLVPGFEELLGIPHDSVPTFTEEWMGYVHPDDIPRLVAENDEALRATSSFRSEYRLRCGNGDYIWVSDWAIVIAGADGKAEWMAGGIRDITVDKALEESRRESTQLHDVLFRRALMPAVLFDGTGALADANQAALDFFEVTREALVERPAADILPADLVNLIAREIGGREQQGTHEVEVEVAGTKKWLLATVVPFETHGGWMAFLLGADWTEHKRMSDALAGSEVSLRNKTQALEERNVALKVLIDQRREDAEELRLSVTDNVEQLVMPTLDRLAGSLAGRPESALVEAVKLTLDEITRPLIRRPDSPVGASEGLSRREYEILQLIKAKKTTEEIARLLYLSPTTVTFHRGNIRRKLGLRGSGRRLASEVMVDTVPRRIDERPPA